MTYRLTGGPWRGHNAAWLRIIGAAWVAINSLRARVTRRQGVTYLGKEPLGWAGCSRFRRLYELLIPPNPGLGMLPATSSPVIRRRLGEAMVHAIGPAAGSSDPRGAWRDAFRAVRAETEARAALLGPEDQVVQSMPDASPTKWHRAHTTWFFEQFLLLPQLPGYAVFDPRFGY